MSYTMYGAVVARNLFRGGPTPGGGGYEDPPAEKSGIQR